MSAAPPFPEIMQGFNVMLGFRFAEWRDGLARLEFDIAPHHLNRSGILHGGVLSALMDATMGYAGVHPGESGKTRRAVTLSMTISFLGQTRSGTVRCTGARAGGGNTIFMATGTIEDASGAALATGQGVYRYIAAEAT